MNIQDLPENSLPVMIPKEEAHEYLKKSGIRVKDMILVQKAGSFLKSRALLMEGASILRIQYSKSQPVEYYIAPPERFI